MDHCEAARNAAKTACPESVVDCFIHVDRCMLKTRGKLNRSNYISTAREHIRILAKITDRDVFQRGADVKVMAEWRCNHENAFAACVHSWRPPHTSPVPPRRCRVLDMRHHPQQVDGVYGVRAGGGGLVFSQADVAMQSRECLCGLVRIGVSGGGLGQRFIPR
jgi:hypothetical protein